MPPLRWMLVMAAIPSSGCDVLLGLGDYDAGGAQPPADQPHLVWVQHLRGDGVRYHAAAEVDVNGDLWLLGAVAETELVEAGTLNVGDDVLVADQTDVMLLRLDGEDGAIAQAHLFEAPGRQSALDLAIAGDGQLYMAGDFIGGDWQLGSGVLTSPGIDHEGWVARSSTDGTVEDAWAFTGTGDAFVRGLAADPSGLYLTGEFHGDMGIASTTQTSVGAADAFVARLSSSDDWASRHGDPNDQFAWSVSSADGYVFAAGFTDGSVGVGLGDANKECSFEDGRRLMVIKLTNEPKGQWVRCPGDGMTDDEARAVHAIREDQVLVAGKFSGPLDFGTVELTSVGSNDAFVAELDGDGQARWAVAFSGPADQTVTAIATDADGHVWVVGDSLGPVTLGESDIVLPHTLGRDAFVVELDPGGLPLRGLAIGGQNDQEIGSVIPLADGSVVLAGSAKGTVDLFGTQIEASTDGDVLVMRIAALD